MRTLTAVLSAALVAAVVSPRASADDAVAEPAADPAAAPVVTVPAGFTIEMVAGPPLVERPIVAAFDDDGFLYVAESSGSNDDVEVQLEQRPHSILRLEDVDSDGRYDKRTVFADRMMFPEGTMFFDGSLYVSAPPTIWKLTDHDGDGVAEDRVEWFTATLTGCANDLHGPYLGPDGWVYWCKGAFAEQTHMVNGREFVTHAAHIFRARPDGSGIEPVMTGGMDNPVDVVFTPEGERLFTATFFESDGRSDGIAHALYGGVFGKQHGVLDGHARTGELMPAMVRMSPAAPCGLERYDAAAFGPDYRGNLFAAQFNLRKVSRHVLRPAGSTWTSEDSDFVVSDHVDFHPTDVLMDADGSLLVVNTGGWYKLCCPTSQLWKPDVPGAIYRVRRAGAPPPADPRGRDIDWAAASLDELWTLLADARPAVRERAARAFGKRRDSAAMTAWLAKLDAAGIVDATTPISASPQPGECDPLTAAVARTWAIGQMESAAALALTRQLLEHPDQAVRHAALSAVSLHRDAAAEAQLVELLVTDSPAVRRVAAEALGRIGATSAVPQLLAAAAVAEDRLEQHSIIYALIELADAPATRAALARPEPRTVAAALMALDQMPRGGMAPREVIPRLSAADSTLRQTARWIVARHAEWGGELTDWFRDQLARLPAPAPIDVAADNGHREAEAAGDATTELETMLVGFAGQPAVQQLLAEVISAPPSSAAGARHAALGVVARAKLAEPPPSWYAALAAAIADAAPAELPHVLDAARALPRDRPLPAELQQALLAIAGGEALSSEVRVTALAAAATGLAELDDAQFSLLSAALDPDSPVVARSAASVALSAAPLAPAQLERLCTALESAGPLELNQLLPPFARAADDRLGVSLLEALKHATALPSLRVDILRQALAGYSPAVQQGIDQVEALVNIDAAAQRARLAELLPLVATGDVRRGHALFHTAKAACSACHRMGYAGGIVGPELSRIGETRTERDLLESILYPSQSFVRSYEPVLIVTAAGLTINGVIRDQSPAEYFVATGPNQEVRVPRDEVEEIRPSTISVMPAGLDKQFTPQELADLVAFLKHGGD